MSLTERRCKDVLDPELKESTYERCELNVIAKEGASLWEYLCFELVPLKKLTTEAIKIADSHGGNKATARSGTGSMPVGWSFG